MFTEPCVKVRGDPVIAAITYVKAIAVAFKQRASLKGTLSVAFKGGVCVVDGEVVNQHRMVVVFPSWIAFKVAWWAGPPIEGSMSCLKARLRCALMVDTCCSESWLVLDSSKKP